MADLPRDIGFNEDPVVLVRYSLIGGKHVPVIDRCLPVAGTQP